MELFLGSRRHDAFSKALDWFGAALTRPALESLIAWADSKSTWGPVKGFVEADVRAKSRLKTRNVDFILAFDDRVAVCEVKAYRNFRNAKSDFPFSVQQCANSHDLVCANLSGAVPDQAIRSFIFYPFLEPEEVQALKDLHRDVSYHHISICGGHRCSDDSGLYLTDIVANVLTNAPGSDSRAHTKNAAEILHSVCVVPNVVRRHRNLDEAIQDLRNLCRFERSILLSDAHVRDCRRTVLINAQERLDQRGLIEVVGSAGVGKSEFIHELLALNEETSGRPLSLVILDCPPAVTPQNLLRSALERFGNDPHAFPSDTLAAQRLCNQPGILWIRRYSHQSAPQIADFVAGLPGDAGARELRIIVESVVSCIPVEGTSISIDALTEAQIFEVLDKRLPGHPGHDRAQIAFWARGNPRLAIARWHSKQLNTAPRASTGPFEWVDYVFEGFERVVLNFVVLQLDAAPLGLTLDLLTTMAVRSLNNMSRDVVAAAVRSVVEKLNASQMVHVYTLRNAYVGPLAALTSAKPFVDINNIDPSLTAYIRRSVPGAAAVTWNETALEALLDSATKPGSLAEVTASLRLGDLWPFCMSAFRHTHRASLLAWLATKELAEGPFWRKTQSDAYLEKAIRLQQHMHLNPAEPIDIAAVLGRPASDAPRQLHVWDALRTKANCYLTDGLCDTDRWTDESDALKDSELRAQSKASLAKALQLEQRYDEAWQILQQLATQLHVLSPATRGVVLFHILAFLNRRKKAQQLPQFSDRRQWQGTVEAFAKQALDLALELENVTYLSSTVFIYVRSLEAVSPPASAEELNGFIDAMRFVEQASPIRALQSVLTQGSLHRHYCLRSQQIHSWTDFTFHADEAFLSYRRAFAAARGSRSTTHVLTATSYCGELCLGVANSPLRENPEAFGYLATRLKNTLDMYKQVRSDFPRREDVSGDWDIWDTIHETYPFLLILAMAANIPAEDTPHIGRLLASAFEGRWASIRQMPYHDRPKSIAAITRNTARSLEFLRTHREGSDTEIQAWREPIEACVRSTRGFIKQHRSRQRDRRIERINEDAERITSLLLG